MGTSLLATRNSGILKECAPLWNCLNRSLLSAPSPRKRIRPRLDGRYIASPQSGSSSSCSVSGAGSSSFTAYSSYKQLGEMPNIATTDSSNGLPRWLNIGQHRPNIGHHRPNIGPTWAQDEPNIAQHRPNLVQYRPKMGPTWLNMGPSWCNISPKWTQDGSTWARLGPTWAQPPLNIGPNCFHTGKHCALCLPQFNIALPGFVGPIFPHHKPKVVASPVPGCQV